MQDKILCLKEDGTNVSTCHHYQSNILYAQCIHLDCISCYFPFFIQLIVRKRQSHDQFINSITAKLGPVSIIQLSSAVHWIYKINLLMLKTTTYICFIFDLAIVLLLGLGWPHELTSSLHVCLIFCHLVPWLMPNQWLSSMLLLSQSLQLNFPHLG